MLLTLLATLAAAPAGEALAQRFQGAFAVFAAKDKPPRLAVGYREFHGEPGRLIGYSLENGGHFFDWGAAKDRVNYGRRLGAIGDLDGDGFEDLAVGCSLGVGGGEKPLVELHSGANGELLGTLEPELDETGFGECPSALPDVDGDGKPDFLVGGSMTSPLKRGNFAFYAVYSGATRQRLGRAISESPSGFMQGPLVVLPGPQGHPWAAHSTGRSVLRLDLGSKVVERSYVFDAAEANLQIVGIAGAGDLDGDGCEELLLALNASGAHAWRLLDGKSWTPRALPAQAALPAGPLAGLARVCDLDGDGTPDFLAERSLSEEDPLSAFSGRTLALLGKLPSPPRIKPFWGGACALARMPDGGLLAFAACNAPIGSAQDRGVYVYDWKKRELLRSHGPLEIAGAPSQGR